MLAVLAGALFAGVICFLVFKSKADRLAMQLSADKSTFEADLALLRNETARLSAEKERCAEELSAALKEIVELREAAAALRTKNESLQEFYRQQQQTEKAVEERTRSVFENIAGKLLEEKQEKFSKMGVEQIRSVLEPFGKDLVSLKRQIEQTHLEEAEKRASLREELKQLMSLNKQLSDDANNLTKALKGEKNAKIQGDWGEMILESILTNSGLEKDVHYFTQQTQKTEEGKLLRPDVIVRYPDGREIVIDSKVSLTAYTRYIESDDEVQREKALGEHILSIRRHVDELSDKQYDRREGALDFVMMFMPIETAYMVALGRESGLWDYAYKKRVILITPTHLITALKLIYDLWRREIQSQNVKKIVERGVLMYEKFDLFVGEMENIDTALNKCRENYDLAMKRLKTGTGNLMWQAQELQKLGIRSTKATRIPQSDTRNETEEEKF